MVRQAFMPLRYTMNGFIAASSCAELDTQLEIVRRMGWLSDIKITQAMLNELTAIIIGLSRAIKIRCDGEN
jgi:four helix bundle protein